ncbi:hypothetical protein AYO20_09906 [Fonsecaea nubica]|uniref:Uncharacterized protein n=1 Tax=Fonsecaea nubica TaxID=856822 RepID=A0A178CCW7_9EURO|nr:hypothetical protein AYO20_09906 [Fonsecaea nubica]OAL26873.1 hypothetical protein AYO20_09906 [Fonsecaea nubica]
MNRLEFAHLLSQTQSMMAPSRAPAAAHLSHDSCPNPSETTSSASLSPRQRFQAHVRTLSDQTASPPRSASASPKRSSELQHVSSLRVSYRESPSPRSNSRSSPTWENRDPILKTFNNTHNEPYFIKEEREAWSRPSPSRATIPLTDDVFLLQPPNSQSPILQPSKQLRELRPFAPLAGSVDVNERPKTSRGPTFDPSHLTIENANSGFGHEDEPTRPSKFAEGSMNARSAGVSSTWHENSSITSCSEIESGDDSTPRASPQRPSIDLNEFKPETAIAPTLKQRLFKFGAKAKPKENTTRDEAEPTAKKKNGLRKSMSLWNLHGDKKKTTDGSGSPEKKSTASNHGNDLEVLNDRKRRAEEAYAQQFGMKRRKSNVGLATATTGDEISQEMLAATRNQTQGKPTSNHSRILSQSPSKLNASDSEWSDGHRDLDHHKRPTRRELEKENQQLRALLRQRQQEKTPQPTTSASLQHPLTPGAVHEDDSSTPKASAKKQSRKQSGTAVPPVPSLPERAALKTLSNTTNQDHAKNRGNGNSGVMSTSGTNDQSKHSVQKQRRRPSVVRGEGFSHPFSAILEEDEETGTVQARKENQRPTNDMATPKLASEMKPGNEAVGIKGMKINHVATMQMQVMQKENWEWPDDVF